MTSSGRYAYAREILTKKATKIVFTIKRLLSNIDSSARQGMNFSMPLLNLYYFMVVKYGDQNYYLIRHILIKVQLRKFTLNSVNKH